MAGGNLTAKGELTRARIVRAAAGEIFLRGVAQTSLDDVKATAGVSSSQLYHYFADKRELVLAVVNHQAESSIERQREAIGALDSIRALRAWASMAVAHQEATECKGGCPLGSIGDDLAEADESVRLEVAAGFDRWESTIRDGLSAMHDRGELRADPAPLAAALFASLQGGLLVAKVRRDPGALRAALDAIIDHIESLSKQG